VVGGEEALLARERKAARAGLLVEHPGEHELGRLALQKRPLRAAALPRRHTPDGDRQHDDREQDQQPGADDGGQSAQGGETGIGTSTAPRDFVPAADQAPPGDRDPAARVRLARMPTGYLGLGSNVGDRRANLQAAVDALHGHGVAVLASSSTYDTDPVGELREQPDFLNACVRIETELAPEALLDACKAVERELGRQAGGPRHGPRTIDVDLLLLGDVEVASARLTLPHEQVLARRFVLIPLLELDFDLTTPAGERLAGALAPLPVDEGVRRAGPPLRVDRAIGPADEPSSGSSGIV